MIAGEHVNLLLGFCGRCDELAVAGFQLLQQLATLFQYLLRYAGQGSHLYAITPARRSVFYGVQKHNLLSVLNGIAGVVIQMNNGGFSNM